MLSPWLLLAWAIIDSTLQGFNRPARMLVTAALAPECQVSRAIAANSIAANIARSIGPAIAGVVMIHSGVSDVFFINAVSFVAITAVLLHIRLWIDRPGLSIRSTPLTGDILLGYSYIRRAPEIAMLFALAVSFSLLARPFTERLPALADGTFEGGPSMLSLFMTAQGVGALFGAGWMMRMRDWTALVRFTVAAAIGIAISLILFTFTSNAVVAFALIAFAGLFHVVCNIGMQTMAQSMSKPAIRGRVLALYDLVFRAGPSLGAFIIVISTQWLGLQNLIGLAAFIFLVGVMTILPQARRIYAFAGSRELSKGIPQ